MQPLSLSQFIATVNLPITPVLNKPLMEAPPSSRQKIGNARQLEGNNSVIGATTDFLVKLLSLALVLTVLQYFTFHRIVRELIDAFGLYFFVGVVMQCVSMLTVGTLNMPVAPHFDRPYLSASFTDFWSRRWNLNTGYALRILVYDPICEGRLVAKPLVKPPNRPSWLRRATAVCASFFVSGIMHEVFIIYLRNRVSGYWLAFFTLQGPIVILESACRKVFQQRGLMVPSAISVPITLGAMLLIADWLFFPDIVEMDAERCWCCC